ncbi:response regulator transcription factor [Marinomonas mediterranea]|jgi:transcriptional regulator, LuxR family|uniref:Transcriptional regulator, LuxR family n=1 Tax=Marinomonas mediterranea (strain ATCC 700492 / JCM 21426 / NBRC 103028 / MMB-1) TaxID=717774 RepID=F2JWX9_MARM1|nr:helix-turn-helix transcriptional regulator [Marinomonas mediterranea]ADZ92996.1 transcriptional regulator, LuxR family [Marinomonas mediterranea MMB-1]WCN10908.1 LuxR family transcriptional regulator [Marinomonas mediterranea]WCN14969.1 LuxR family transcriptional regulator [Marinomonas mediterranea]WCN19014.1 LuxR family transcriptional regulator [Marinomonas mediterranea MMB-1]
MHKTQVDTSSLIKDLAVLTTHLRVHSFPVVMESFLSNLCYFDTILMVSYKKSLRPVLIHPLDPAEHSPSLKLYLNKAYIIDPLFNSIQNGINSGICRLVDIAPDSFEETEYFQTCYKKFDLVDEINLIVSVDQSTTLAITLGRKKVVGSIRRTELNNLKTAFPMIEALIGQFWLAQARDYLDQAPKKGALKHALKTFARGVLTAREQEILGLILRGHSSKAIADLLSISAGTVKVHRKNIHARLNTSTQSEIFTLFLNHLDDVDNT